MGESQEAHKQAGEHGPCPFPLVGGNVFLRADLTRLCLELT